MTGRLCGLGTSVHVLLCVSAAISSSMAFSHYGCLMVEATLTGSDGTYDET